MAKIREELEIVSSDDLNSLLNRLNKLKDEIKDTNNTTVKPKKEVTAVELISYESASVEEELEKVEETINEELATETVAEGK